MSGDSGAPDVSGLRAEPQDPPSGRTRRLAQVTYLHRTQPELNLLTALVCLMFGAWWGRGGWADDLWPWIILGGMSVILRLGSQVGLRSAATASLTNLQLRRFLHGATLSAAAAGLMMGWGWVVWVPRMSPELRDVFLMAQAGLLIGALHALRPCLPAFLAFVAASLLPALAWSTGLTGSSAGGTFTTLGLIILAATAVGFAVRFSQEFHAGLRLQERVQALLEEVTAKRDEAVKATQAKSRFLASVSHDLRQPMYAMNLYLSTAAGHVDRLLARPGDTASMRGLKEGIRSLQGSIVYLNSMFESLLDISRLNAGRVDAEIRYTVLTGMLEQLRSDYRRQAISQGLRFEMRLPAQIPLMEVETDPALLERLLRNLLVNAFRYTRTGGVRLSLVARPRSLDFRVVDTGPGIERSLRTRVFEEFFRVPEDDGPVAGLLSGAGKSGGNPPGSAEAESSEAPLSGRGIGLGLSISARLADKMGSRIRLHSRLGHGSVFAFRQPMRIALRPQGQDRPASGPTGDAALPGHLFVAVIDDEREIRHATRQLLESMGVDVFTASSGQQAVEQLGRLGRVPDLLLCDYRMGGENGLEAITLLREEFNRDIPAVLITGDTSPDRLQEFSRAGLSVLYKPVSTSELFATMRSAIQRGPAPRKR